MAVACVSAHRSVLSGRQWRRRAPSTDAPYCLLRYNQTATQAWKHQGREFLATPVAAAAGQEGKPWGIVMLAEDEMRNSDEVEKAQMGR